MSAPQEETAISKSATEQLLRECMSRTGSRLDLWVEFIQRIQAQRIVEIGVYRGDFAAEILQRCSNISKYYMIDPWRHLDNWNKPANQNDAVFESFYQEAKKRTDFAASRRLILRGRTLDVIDEIPDGELDLAYIDGDHTLRGIAVDLLRVYPKVKSDGFICGDDFTRSVWEHKTSFEPTLVFPFAVYFAEAVGATIYSLPHSQFCLHKTASERFSFVDLTGYYSDTSLQSQIAPDRVLKLALSERFPRLKRMLASVVRLLR